MPALTVLVLADPASPFLKRLENLPQDLHLVVGKEPAHLAETAAQADVLFACNQPRALVREVFLACPRLRWVHCMSAGVEGFLFPELIESPVPLTNGAGVFARSLSEFVVASMLFFSKDLRRLIRQQEAGKWEQFDSEELAGKTMGIIGYGGLGRSCARLAKAFDMQVLALRRRPELSQNDALVDRVFAVPQVGELAAASDYVVISSPNTPDTKGLVSEAVLRAMKPTGVLINIGRGPVVDEKALIDALREKRIRGASLDVFDKEPLPEGHPFYSLDNLLLSPHCADHVPGWLEGAVDLFVKNFHRFQAGQPLENLVNKQAGY